MTTHHWLLSATLVFTGGLALATAPAAAESLTRAEVKQAVLDVGASGGLAPAGEAAEYERPRTTAKSALTRGEVRRDVIAGRSAGELEPAGEAEEPAAARIPVPASTLARATVKAETRLAEARGELVPAGEGDVGQLRTRARQSVSHRAVLASSQ